MQQFFKPFSVLLCLCGVLLVVSLPTRPPELDKDSNFHVTKVQLYNNRQDEETNNKCTKLQLEDNKTEIIVGIKNQNGGVEFESIFDKSGVYNISSGIAFEVKCLSRSPVTLKFHGLMANRVRKSSTYRYSDPDNNFCFENRVEIYSSKPATGRYECVNTPDGITQNNDTSKYQNINSTIYIFAGGNAYSPNLLHAGKSIDIPSSSNKSKLVLPCLTNNASVPIHLFKDGQQISSADDDGFTYNPMEGFTVSNSNCGDIYVCTDHINLSDSSRNVKFEVNCPKNLDNLPKLKFKMGVFNQSNEVKMEYQCFGATSMSSVSCDNLLECEFLNSCGTSVKQRGCNSINAYNCEGANIGSSPCLSISTSANDTFRGLLFCSNEKETIRIEIFNDIKGNKAFDFDFTKGVARPKRKYNKWLDFIPSIYKTWNNVGSFNLYETTQFQCNASKVLASNGIEWLFELKNGSKIPAVTKDKNVQEVNGYYSKSSDISFNYSQISKLICRAPKLFGQEWHEIEHDITMLPYHNLQLLNSANETRQISQASELDDEHKLTCTAIGTNIEISWRKNNGVVAGSHDVFYSNINETMKTSTIIVVFDKSGSSRASQWEDIYSCIVKSNVLNETITKHFKVEWIKVGRIPPLLFAVIAAIIIVFVAIILIGYKWLKTHWKNKALEKLRKEFFEGIKQETIRRNKDLAGNNDYEKEKTSTKKYGDPDYFLTLPYNKEFEIADKNIEIGPQLGGGNFGDVYSGLLKREGGHNIDIAIKILKDCPTEKQWKDFLNEIKLLQQLKSHENLVKFIGAVTVDMFKTKKPKIIFELCEGGDLHSYLNQLKDCNFEDELTTSTGYTTMELITDPTPSEGGLTYLVTEPRIKTRHLFKWCYEIALGMEHLSSLGVVHRDIACRNTLLTRDLVAKVADMGLSKVIPTQNQKECHYYSNNNNFYTPSSTDEVPVRWVAIEALEERKFSEDSDIWAMGVLMWEVFNLCRCHPYPHISNTDGNILQTLKDELNSGERLSKPKYANDEIYEVMLKCWAHERTSRPRFNQLKKLIREAEEAMYTKNNNSWNGNQSYSEYKTTDIGETDSVINYSPVVIIPMTEEQEF